MFKRLITWLYERFCQEKPLTTAELEKLNFIYRYAREVRYEFMQAGYLGSPKPEYPKKMDGCELSEDAKKILDAIYVNAGYNRPFVGG